MTTNLRSSVIRLAAVQPPGSTLRIALLNLVSYDNKPIGKARYKGKTYNLLFMGPTRYGERARLQFMDGSKDFWVDAKLVENLSGGGGSSGGGSSGGGSSGGRPGRASPKQVSYALGLVQRVVRGGGWFDTDWGDTGVRPFTESDLEKMTSREISEVIEVLKMEV